MIQKYRIPGLPSALTLSILAANFLTVTSSYGEQSSQPDQNDENDQSVSDYIYVTGGQDEIKKIPGSATLVDSEALEQFEYTDIHRILNQVPGINLQEEDGYGLRPNIGMRGTAPERSKKITIMEDGVLSGPAPYSASAAYYFPNVSRMDAVEVFKGPAAIQFGPATVAGAVNLVSRQIPLQDSGELDIQYGAFDFQRLNSYYGGQQGNFGYLVEALNIGTEGFKELDDANTGFDRNDFSGKFSWYAKGTISQTFQLKLGYADENSNESYLGLTRDDFDNDPLQRYGVTSLDNMQWDHKRIHLSHIADLSLSTQLVTDTYQNEFSRDWFKVNGFNNSIVDIADVLKNPNSGNNNDFYQLLDGVRDSSGSSFEQILIGNNGRDYLSQGLQTRLLSSVELASMDHNLEIGIRYHQDQVERNHTEQAYNMLNGRPVVAPNSELYATKVNKGSAQAIAAFVKDEIQYENHTISLGLRTEFIETKLENYLTGTSSSATETIWLPGMGFYSEINQNFGILGGVHKGFTATAPGQTGDIKPEESTNYEFGFRLFDGLDGLLDAELIAFVNDYQNLKGTCSFNNGCTGASVDDEVNGGEAWVYGLESSLSSELTFGDVSMPLNFVYTYTDSEFRSDFIDNSGVFGDKGQTVRSGDKIAYLPIHRLNFKTGLIYNKWQWNLSASYQSDVRDTPSQGEIPESDLIESHLVVDTSLNYQAIDNLQLYVNLDNLLGSEYIVSAQPMGYRPGKPRTVQVGLKFKF